MTPCPEGVEQKIENYKKLLRDMSQANQYAEIKKYKNKKNNGNISTMNTHTWYNNSITVLLH